MMHPHTEVRFINDVVGYGVVATRFIPKGTITWALDKLDRVFTPAEVERMETAYQQIVDRYCFRDNKGNFVLCWDISRFVNHSFRSNCISTAYDYELAVRDIQPGEELTDDYGYLNVTEPFDCLPEGKLKRTRVMPDDLLHYHKQWDGKLKEAFRYFDKVHQPLAPFVKPENMERSMAIAQGQAKMDSILSCYFDPAKNVATKNGATKHA